MMLVYFVNCLLFTPRASLLWTGTLSRSSSLLARLVIRYTLTDLSSLYTGMLSRCQRGTHSLVLLPFCDPVHSHGSLYSSVASRHSQPLCLLLGTLSRAFLFKSDCFVKPLHRLALETSIVLRRRSFVLHYNPRCFDLRVSISESIFFDNTLLSISASLIRTRLLL